MFVLTGVKGACGDISIAVASDVELRLWLKLDQTDGVIGSECVFIPCYVCVCVCSHAEG